MKQIQVGIVGYGNIGKGVEKALARNGDMKLAAVFTRREPQAVKPATPGVRVERIEDAKNYQGQIDVMMLCGGSMSDLPEQGPLFASEFHTVDSFDTHAKIPEYLAKMDRIAKEAGKTAMISSGWDPGLFSMMRLLSGAALPDGRDYTFWGRGVSQGHSDAVRRVEGVANAIQYTVPVESAVEAVRAGLSPDLTTRQKHTRECFVAPKPGADLEKIKRDILTMPNYFADYDTTVTFVTEEELRKNHAGMPHAGMVLRSGTTGEGENRHVMEFSLKLESNPEFTASVMVTFARAALRLAGEGKSGCFTPFDVPLAYLSAKPRDQLIKELL